MAWRQPALIHQLLELGHHGVLRYLAGSASVCTHGVAASGASSLVHRVLVLEVPALLSHGIGFPISYFRPVP